MFQRGLIPRAEETLVTLIYLYTDAGRVVDPFSFFPDPDPEFDVRDQYGSGSGSGSNTDPGL